MSLVTRAIPGLFGGVSQAIPAMRHATQGELQENALSTVVSGLFKRPGSKHVAQLPLAWANGTSESLIGNVHCHVVDKGSAGRWQLIFGTAGITAVDMQTGATEPVVYQDANGNAASMPTYLNAADPSTAFRTITVADTTFIVNSEVTVAAQNTDSSVPLAGWHFVYVKTGVPGHSYRIYVNGTLAQHSAPTSGVVTVDTVVSGLVSALQAIGGVTVNTYSTPGLIGIHYSGNWSCVVGDTYGNTAITCLTNGVKKFSELPPGMVSGRRLTVLGDDVGADIDPYYVVWNGSQWVESRKYGINTGLNPATMPHKVFRQGGSWYVRPIVWGERLTGDDATNPMPSFVGKRLRDIFFYRNRLGFLAGDSLCMSRSGDYYNFFAKTARDILDTDPIDLSGAAESVETLDWAVPFREKLVVWATRDQQFMLDGGEVLTPNTAKLVPSTAFESTNSAAPKQLGNRVVFASTNNGYTQMALYRVAGDTVSTTAEPVTDHVPTYVPDRPRAIELSETAKTLAIVPPGKGNELYVFKYEDDGEKLSQRAWQKFVFGGGIVKAHWAGQLLYLTTLYRNATPTGQAVLCLEVLDFAPNAVDDTLSFPVRLDRKVWVNGATATGTFGEVNVTVTMPDSDDLKVFRYSGSSDPLELPIVSKTLGTSNGKTTITFRVKSSTTSGTFMVGRKYTMRYRFTEVFFRDQHEVPVMDARVKLLKMILRYVRTGYFKVKVTTKAGGSYEYGFSGAGVGVGQLLGAEPALVNGEFAIPVHAQATGTTVDIESDSHLPCCFPYAEWRGNVEMKSSR